MLEVLLLTKNTSFHDSQKNRYAMLHCKKRGREQSSLNGVWCMVLSKKRKSRPLGRLKKKHVIIVHVGSSNLKTNRKQNKRRGIA